MSRVMTNSGLQDEAGNAITNLNADFTTRPYALGDYRHIGHQLGWDNAAVTGTLILEYSCDPIGTGDGTDVNVWTEKSSIPLDGSFAELLILDSNVPIAAWRFRFVHSAGTANLTEAFVTRRD